MVAVDSWLVYKQATKSQEDQRDFYSMLAEELIDNRYDHGLTGTRSNENGLTPEIIDQRTGAGRAGLSVHLTPSKRKRKTRHGIVTNHTAQGKCRECKRKTKYQCSECVDAAEGRAGGGQPMPWFCHTDTSRMCFPTHISESHNNSRSLF